MFQLVGLANNTKWSELQSSMAGLGLKELNMLVNIKGQVTIPKHIRAAAGVAAGSEVTFTLDAGRIIITRVASHAQSDRRAKLRSAAAHP